MENTSRVKPRIMAKRADTSMTKTRIPSSRVKGIRQGLLNPQARQSAERLCGVSDLSDGSERYRLYDIGERGNFPERQSRAHALSAAAGENRLSEAQPLRLAQPRRRLRHQPHR